MIQNNQILKVENENIPLFVRLLLSQTQKVKIQREVENNIWELTREWMDSLTSEDLLKYFREPVFDFTYAYCQKNKIVFPELIREAVELVENMNSNDYFMQSLRDSIIEDYYPRVSEICRQSQKGGF